MVVTDWSPCDEAIRELRDRYHFHDIKIPILRMLGDNGGWFKTKGRKTKKKWGRILKMLTMPSTRAMCCS